MRESEEEVTGRTSPASQWGAIATVVVGLLIVGSTVLVIGRCVVPRGFDPAEWRAQCGNFKDNSRYAMVVDLKRDYLRVGLPRAEVRACLGPPDSATEFEDLYFIGYGSLSPSPQYYVIRYNKDLNVQFFMSKAG